jgi:hypothetical protein
MKLAWDIQLFQKRPVIWTPLDFQGVLENHHIILLRIPTWNCSLKLTGGSCNNLDADFGSWILDAGFCIIALHRLDSTSAACDGLVVISIVVIDGTEYTLPHSSHSNNELHRLHFKYDYQAAILENQLRAITPELMAGSTPNFNHRYTF